MEGVVLPCVGCGYCCKMSSCGFGRWEPGGCVELIRDEKLNRYVCGKYDEIRAIPGSDVCPGFGGGCGQSLFNERRRILVEEGRLLA